MDHVVVLPSLAEKFLHRYKRYRYYYSFVERLYACTIPAGSRVLHVGCADGFLLRACKPTYACGVDDSAFATLFNVPEGLFFPTLAHLSDTHFDYVVIGTRFLKNSEDVQKLFAQVRKFCHERTRVIIDYTAGHALPFTAEDMRLLCTLSDLEIVCEKRELIIPLGIPFLADLINYGLARMPVIRHLCLKHVFITRFVPVQQEKLYSVSVIIPCKNEAGNIEGAIARTPDMGSGVEFILVDGHSKDGSAVIMQNMVTGYPEKNISWFVQSSKGKKNAVEEGFARATGDIIMILDGDITVIPEELPKFYAALASGKGECINGSRLVYPMDREAMRPLNWVVNGIFGFMVSYLIGQRVKDTLCGTKVFFRKDLRIIAESKKFFGDIDPFGDFDILCGAAYCNLKIIDMPVHYKKRTYGAPGIAFFKSGLLLLSMTYVVAKKWWLRR